MTGPQLASHVINSLAMVQHPAGGVLAIISNSRFVQYLASARDVWKYVSIDFKTDRFWTTALLIRDDLVNCSLF